MLETIEAVNNLDARTRNLLTSSTPDISVIEKCKPSKTALKDGRKVIDRALNLLAEAGVPPWQRLGFYDPTRRRTFTINTAVPEEEAVQSPWLFVKQFPDSCVAIREKVASLEAQKQSFKELFKWIVDSPLRLVEFPLGMERTISLLITEPKAEETISIKAELNFFEKAIAIPLPTLKIESCKLAFRTDAWVNPENGNPRWMAFAFDGNNGAGHFPINRAAVNCLNAVVDLAYIHIFGKMLERHIKELGMQRH